MQLFQSRLETPMGAMLLVTDRQDTIHALEFTSHVAHLYRGLSERYGVSELASRSVPESISSAFEEYFAGELSAINALSTATAGTDLQQRVWHALRSVPPGTTTTYGKLAKALGFDDPRAAIDVGAANAANPVAIVVPCHRVIASNGDLKGYAWGVHRKRWLLGHEKVTAFAGRVPYAMSLPGF
ncbi:methylated-DNA--[protein]-cysteine S-methyltransferase [Burkholderia sp. D-99]|uniref:methylated-DNA--[protein]-cysteine S-methyltransferase n=1 Tax=Burkholderia sp. D-99 TaxID=2717316 RepID=UPI0014200436|nr:methylated-DNA--[protein]-cysteine S-methyltransferase [Burkholderia sp. D-99]NHV26915.1 methylated-DNA--[protein]-cysteine S-methyltransferase [Burkholderia sp. D-99]